MGAIRATTGAMCTCPFGAAPSSLNVLPAKRVMAGKVPCGEIQSFIPCVNIMPFAVCRSLSNPTVAAATAAAMGVLTPMPCVPVTTPWIPTTPQIMVGNSPIINVGDITMCAWGGVITIVAPGQATVM
jgi:hypothetical protein